MHAPQQLVLVCWCCSLFTHIHSEHISLVLCESYFITHAQLSNARAVVPVPGEVYRPPAVDVSDGAVRPFLQKIFDTFRSIALYVHNKGCDVAI